MISPFLIPIDRFDNLEYIEARVFGLEPSIVGSVRTALRYLYITDGPINLPRDRMLKAQPFLEPAERVVVHWLYTRTNGRAQTVWFGSAPSSAQTTLSV